MVMLTEVWLPVKGFARYEVSNHGRVRCGDVIVSQCVKKTGYRRVALTIPGGQHHKYVHRLVAEAFIGERPDGMEVNHKDGDKANNSAANLEYVTHAENIRHAVETGLIPVGQDKPQARYTEAQVRMGYELVKSGMKYREASEATGLHFSLVCDVCSGRAWKHLGLPVIRRHRRSIVVPAA